jgi:uncharacterized membrane protein
MQTLTTFDLLMMVGTILAVPGLVMIMVGFLMRANARYEADEAEAEIGGWTMEQVFAPPDGTETAVDRLRKSSSKSDIGLILILGGFSMFLSGMILLTSAILMRAYEPATGSLLFCIA